MPFSCYPNFFYRLFAYPYLKVSRFLPIAYACLFSYLPQNVISNRNTLKKQKGFSFSNSTLLRIPNTINFSYLQKIYPFFDHVCCSLFKFIYSFLFIYLYIQLSFFFCFSLLPASSIDAWNGIVSFRNQYWYMDKSLCHFKCVFNGTIRHSDVNSDSVNERRLSENLSVNL